MPRFYVPHPLSASQNLVLPDSVTRHLQVLRQREGDTIILFNGNGNDYPAKLVSLEKRHAEVIILDEVTLTNESPLHITLIQAISSGERMDFTLQKSVELGVVAIQPVLSERCVVRLSGERADKRMARWQDIVISACEQSGRAIVPPVLPILSYNNAWPTMPGGTLKLLLSLNHAQSLSTFTPELQKIAFMVGPEGGWTNAEEQLAFNAGFHSITLGPRVLRTETAALAALAAMQTLWGDFT